MTPVFTIKDALSYAWKKLSENFWFLVLLTLAFGVVSAALDKTGGDRPVEIATAVLAILVSEFAMFAFVRFSLKIWKGEKPFWNDLFAFKPITFGRYILASFYFTVLGFAVGALLIVIAGIAGNAGMANLSDLVLLPLWVIATAAPVLFVSVRFGLFGFILVEEDARPVAALKKSYALTKGRFWPLLGLAVVLLLINIAGAIAFGLGLLVTAPLTLLATVYVYGKIKAAPAIVASAPAAPSNQA